jgi:ADP-ribose pyrophosphatase
MDYEILAHKVVFEGKVFRIRSDVVRKPTGEKTRFDLVEHAGAVVMIPQDNRGLLWLVRQYRHPTGGYILEFPAGTLDPGEDPRQCAIRECREEIGMSPAGIQPLGGFFLAPGYSTEFIQAFLVRDLQPAPLPKDADEDLQAERHSLSTVHRLIQTGEIVDAKTIASFYLAQKHFSE